MKFLVGTKADRKPNYHLKSFDWTNWTKADCASAQMTTPITKLYNTTSCVVLGMKLLTTFCAKSNSWVNSWSWLCKVRTFWDDFSFWVRIFTTWWLGFLFCLEKAVALGRVFLWPDFFKVQENCQTFISCSNRIAQQCTRMLRNFFYFLDLFIAKFG